MKECPCASGFHTPICFPCYCGVQLRIGDRVWSEMTDTEPAYVKGIVGSLGGVESVTLGFDDSVHTETYTAERFMRSFRFMSRSHGETDPTVPDPVCSPPHRSVTAELLDKRDEYKAGVYGLLSLLSQAERLACDMKHAHPALPFTEHDEYGEVESALDCAWHYLYSYTHSGDRLLYPDEYSPEQSTVQQEKPMDLPRAQRPSSMGFLEIVDNLGGMEETRSRLDQAQDWADVYFLLEPYLHDNEREMSLFVLWIHQTRNETFQSKRVPIRLSSRKVIIKSTKENFK